MTMRISVPLDAVRRLLFLTLAWGGAAAIALGFSYWLDDEGLTREDLRGYATNAELQNYATDSDLASTRTELSSVPTDALQLTTGPGSGLRLAIADLLLLHAADGDLPPPVIKDAFFPGVSSTDFDICIASYRSARNVEACTRVMETAFLHD